MSDPESTIQERSALLRRLLPEYLSSRQRIKIGRQVAEGGMGVIFEAKETSTGRKVAMKVMRVEATAGNLSRFIGEGRITATLEHPNIVPVHELGIDDQEQAFYTMKYIEGQTLQEVLNRLQRCEPEAINRYQLAELLTIFQKICDAVSFAHSRHVIHRDLKPSNIMLGPFGEVLVVDWGLAKYVGSDPESVQGTPALFQNKAESESLMRRAWTRDGELVGTPSFMAPEQAEGRNSQADEQTDIYALGAILYWMLVLRSPVSGDSAEAILQQVRSGMILSPAVYPGRFNHLPDGRVPTSLAAVTMRALSLLSGDRYRSVSELQQEITAYQSGFATQAEQAGFLKQLALAFHRHRREGSILILSVVLILGTVIGAFVMVNSERRRAEKERDRASEALAALRDTAPLFSNEGRTLEKLGQFDLAVKKLEYALALRPDVLPDLRLKAELLESTLRLKEAKDTYASILTLAPSDDHARAHFQLCSEISGSSSHYEISVADMKRLLSVLATEHRPIRQLKTLFQRLGLPESISQGFSYTTNGLLALSMRGLAVTDLDMLAGLPIHSLDAANCAALHDIAGIKGAPLEKLNLYGTAVANLEPLRGMSLRSVDLRNSAVTDISPLVTSPVRELLLFRIKVRDFTPLGKLTELEFLDLTETEISDLSQVYTRNLRVLRIGHTKIHDLSPLAGSKLERIHFDSIPATDVTPLLQCPELRWIIPPETARNIGLLRNLPNLKKISYGWGPESEPDKDAADFWREYDQRRAGVDR